MGRTLDDVRAFVRADHGLATVSFARPDGSVHSSVVNSGVMDHPVTGSPSIAFVVRGHTVKLNHWRRDPRATIVFRAAWAWIGAEGTVTLIGPDDHINGFKLAEVPQLLRDVFTSAGGTHDDWDEYDRVMAEERRAAVLLDPQRIRGVGHPPG